MAIPNFLFLQHRELDTETVVFQYQDGITETQVGSRLSNSVEAGGSSYFNMHRDRVIQANGDLYAVGYDGVYKKDDPTIQGGTWTNVITPTDITPTAARKSGIYPVVLDGNTPYLTAVFGTSPGSGNKFRAVSLNLVTDTWTTSAEFNAVNGAGYDLTNTCLSYHNEVFWVIADSLSDEVEVMRFNPQTQIGTSISNPVPDQHRNQHLFTFNDRLFLLYLDTSETITLAEYINTSFTDVGTYGTTINTTFLHGKMSAIPDEDHVYLLVPHTTEGWRCLQLDSSLSATDITSFVLPDEFIPVAEGGSWSGYFASERFATVFDSFNYPEDPRIYLYHSTLGAETSFFSAWLWNGSSQKMTIVGSGGNAAHAVPSWIDAGGDRIWTAGNLHGQITSIASVDGGRSLSFEVTGGGTGRVVRVLFQTEREAKKTQATLQGSVTGGTASRDGNKVIGVDADGSTVYTVDVDHVTSGITLTDWVGYYLSVRTA